MTPIDLNLLQTFDALFELRSTTRAADRLGLTQSAVSHALRRLRDAFDDPLFVRSGRSLQPTARALEMAPQVHAGLLQLRGALSSSRFDPAAARRTFTIAAGSYFCTLVAPDLIARTRRSAPGIAIRLVPLDKDLPTLLEDGSVDLAVGLFDRIPDRFVAERLFSDEFAWIAAADHPLANRRVTKADLDAHPQLQIGVVHPFGMPSALMEIRQVAEVTGLDATSDTDPAAVVYEGVSAIAAVSCSDLIAQVPRRLAAGIGKSMGIVRLETDRPTVSFVLSALQHRRLHKDAGILWLIDQIRSF